MADFEILGWIREEKAVIHVHGQPLEKESEISIPDHSISF